MSGHWTGAWDCCVHCEHDAAETWPYGHEQACAEPECTPPAKGDCPASDTGGHYFEKQDGQWVCTLEEAS